MSVSSSFGQSFSSSGGGSTSGSVSTSGGGVGGGQGQQQQMMSQSGGHHGRTLLFSNSSAAPMEGLLSKWTNVMNGWKFRWFLLDENTGLLSYYTSKEKMRRGVRRGCIRLQGAVLGIDDEEDANFTITVDGKVFHLQAKDAEEREIWVRALEDAILKHARLRPGTYLPHHISTSGPFAEEPLVRFEQRLAQADVYLQMLISQIATLEPRIELTNVVNKANEFLDAVKHSIVLLQIAKNTAFPVSTGLSSSVILHYSDPEVQTGIAFGAECEEGLLPTPPARSKTKRASLGSVTGLAPSVTTLQSRPLPTNPNPKIPLSTVGSPLTPSEKSSTTVLFSYSSSDEEDFFDAAEDFEADERKDSLEHEELAGQKELGLDPSRSPGEVFENNLTNRVEMPTGKSNTNSVRSVHPQRRTPPPAEIDYDALYEEDPAGEDPANFEAHGSVLSHLLSQVKIGMDLTKVVLPTFILERRSLLEMYADFFAHPDMFTAIADAQNPKDRMIAVLRWYLGAFHAGRRSEVAKKPYNPILGEVFQCYWNLQTTKGGSGSNGKSGGSVPPTPTGQNSSSVGSLLPWVNDSNAVVFLAEQVSHHPPISAFYAEHVGKKISLNAHIWTKSKFLGLSIGVHNIGHAVLTLHSPTREDYVFGFPNGYARSIFSIPWVELGGAVTISSSQTGYSATVDFKTKGFFGGEKNKILAQAFCPTEKKKPFLTVEGEWNGLMTAKWSDGKSEKFVDVKRLEIMKKRTKPVNEQEPNESRRMWKDVTAGLKFKDIDKATEAKSALEEKQRAEAKIRTQKNETWKPKYFIAAGDTWIFTEPFEQRLKFMKKAGAAGKDTDLL